MRERLAIHDEAAARLLCRPRLQGVVAALIEEACTMRDLVGCSGMSYSLLSHHLRRMQALGLVSVVGHAPRAGRASPLYRATARSYFIPAAWCHVLPGDQMSAELREGLQRAIGPKGLLLWGEGGPRMRLVTDRPRQDVVELWMRLRLAPSDARQFNEELRALFERWRGQESTTGPSYLAHGALVRSGAP